LHFNKPGDFDVIEPEFAHIRSEEYSLFKTPVIREWVEENELLVVGLREIRERLRTDLV
jgi:hypothetical protein